MVYVALQVLLCPVIKEILDLSNYIPIENWLNDTGNRSIVESMIDKNKVKLLDII